MELFASYRNKTGNRVLNVYGKLNGDSEKYYEAELFIKGISQGLEAITKGQVMHRYPVFTGIGSVPNQNKRGKK
mgnify:FL=1|tara:strand:+ start:28 stop:249 length:222 start_codon:yes stop_codon:yes gene_type:complete